MLQHDTNLPRPYSLGVQGSGNKGLWMDLNNSVYVEGISKPHEWDEAKSWFDNMIIRYGKNIGMMHRVRAMAVWTFLF